MKSNSLLNKTALTVVMAAMMLTFQNCSPVQFDGFSDAAKDVSTPGATQPGGSGTGDGPDDGTGNPNLPGDPTQTTGCKDGNGTTYKEGDVWTVVDYTDRQVSCPDSSSRTQKMRITLSMMCKDGVIRQTGTTITPESEVPACPAPSLAVEVNPKVPAVNSNANLFISTRNVQTVSYICNESTSGKNVKQGNAAVGDATIQLLVEADLRCDVQARTSDGKTLDAHVDIPVDCGSKVKVGGRCQDFSCRQLVPIVASADGTFQVPGRTTEGICYSVKLMDAIANSSSKLTTALDSSVVSRNHDTTSDNLNDVRNPYVLGRKTVAIEMGGAREVKLSGQGDRLAPILVDNFLVVGKYPKAEVNPGASYFKAYGTSDASPYEPGSILLNQQKIPLQAFATGGTSTIAPLTIGASSAAEQPFNLDIRALDCGGSRELSNIYLLFQ